MSAISGLPMRRAKADVPEINPPSNRAPEASEARAKGLIVRFRGRGSPESPVRVPAEAMEWTLDRRRNRVAHEDEHVPWVVREYDRGYRVLFSHCIAARRRVGRS